MSGTYKAKNLNMPLFFLNVYNEFLRLSTTTSLTVSIGGPSMTWPWRTVPHFTPLWLCFLGTIYTNLIFHFLKQVMLPFYPGTFVYAAPSTCKVAPFHILLVYFHSFFRAWVTCQFPKVAFSNGHHPTPSNQARSGHSHSSYILLASPNSPS